MTQNCSASIISRLSCLIIISFSSATAGAQSPPHKNQFEFQPWSYDVSGDILIDGETRNLDSDLNVDRNRGRRFSMVLTQWAGGWIPEVELDFTDTGVSGQGEVETGATFGPITLAPGVSTLQSSGEIKRYQAIARWQLNSHGWQLLPGFSGGVLDGSYLLVDSENDSLSREEFNVPYAQAHLKVRYRGWAMLTPYIEGSWIEFEGDAVKDWGLGARVHLFSPVTVSAGYYKSRYQLDQENGYVLNATLSGFRLGIGFEW